MAFSLHLSTVSLAATQLGAEGVPAGLSAYESLVFDFCRRWLKGQESFTLPTSGSTGTPKNIELTRFQLETSARATLLALDLRPDDSLLATLPAGYIAGTMMLVRGLVGELAVTVREPSRRPLDLLAKEAAFDFLSFVPLQLNVILTETPEKAVILNRAKAILVGGAPVSPSLEEALQTLTAPVYHTYGMTETVSHVALRRLNGGQKQDYFQALPGVVLGQDERKCLTIRTPTLPGQTLVTNDWVEIVKPNGFRWLGRVDNVINSGGLKVAAEKVERAVEKTLLSRGLTQRFFVTGTPHPEWGQAVTLVLESEPWSAEEQHALLAALRDGELSRYEVPKAIWFRLPFHETPTGKVDRNRTVASVSEK